jgi:hypothetical protein
MREVVANIDAVFMAGKILSKVSLWGPVRIGQRSGKITAAEVLEI